MTVDFHSPLADLLRRIELPADGSRFARAMRPSVLADDFLFAVRVDAL